MRSNEEGRERKDMETRQRIEKCVHTFNREQNRQGIFRIRASLSQINNEGFFTESC